MTLWPAPVESSQSLQWCLMCGQRDGADAVLNVLLFMPLGMLLAFLAIPTRSALLVAAALSAAIELAQLIIPGRDPSIRDLLTNVIGAGAGVLLARSTNLWLVPSQANAAALSTSGGFVALFVMSMTGALLLPSYTGDAYFAQWTQERVGQERYQGTVQRAAIGELALPDGPLVESDSVRRLLFQGAAIRVSVLAGPPVSSRVPVFAIVDARTRDMVSVGVTPEDLVLRSRTIAAGVKLDQPGYRIRGAMRNVIAGDSLRIAISREGSALCLAMNETRHCERLTVGSGWRVLHDGDAFPGWGRSALGMAWVLVLAIPTGFWGRLSWVSIFGIAPIAFGLAVVPVVSGLATTPATEWMAAIAGVILGNVVQPILRRVGHRATPRGA